LLVIGDGAIKSELEEHAKSLNIADRVIFTGFILDPQSYLYIIDVFLLSSLSEGTSMTLLEAMACAKPCVVTDVGGNPEIILHQKNGLVTPNKDVESFYRAIRKLLEEPKTALLYAKAAREQYESTFTVSAMISRYQSLYEQCAKV